MEIIANGIRPDHQVIFDMIDPESRILDLGCGTGDLLHLLAGDKDARVVITITENDKLFNVDAVNQLFFALVIFGAIAVILNHKYDGVPRTLASVMEKTFLIP